jgi:hypothetical protein
MQQIRAYKLAPTYKMTLMYFLDINNQFILYKVNGVPLLFVNPFLFIPCIIHLITFLIMSTKNLLITSEK